MADRFRAKIVGALIDEIARLSGGAFEQFGYLVLPLVQPGDWIEKGTTNDGAPRGGAVDTSLGGAAYIGEMSSKARYFHKPCTKPLKDLDHALKLHPQAKHLWVMSSREQSPSQSTHLDNLVAEFKSRNSTIISVEIMDARRIAKHVYRHIGKHDLVSSLTPFLPCLARLAEEHAFSHAIPDTNRFTPRAALERRVLAELKEEPYVVLRGMSGAGKTALAARIARNNASQFDNVVWHDARAVDRIERLSNLAITASGLTHNIASLLLNERILLVLDDPSFPSSDLSTVKCGPSSRIIITTQVASGEHIIDVGDLDDNDSRKILDKDMTTICPVGLLEDILATVGGHALTLMAFNQLAQEGGWSEVERCLQSDSVTGLEDAYHQKIVERLLARPANQVAQELQFLKWCGTARFHIELASAASSVAVGNLTKRGFISHGISGYARVHDLVFLAIENQIVVSEANRSRFGQRLVALIREKHDQDHHFLQRVAQSSGILFLSLLTNCREPALVYMVALNRSHPRALDLLGDPVTDATVLLDQPSLVDSSLEIRAVIETVEALFTLRTDFRSQIEARKGLERDLRALSSLLKHTGLSDQQRETLAHHRAKMLVRIGRQKEAIEVWRLLLHAKPGFSAARLQLARLLPRAAAIQQCERLLRQRREQPATVSQNLVMEALALLTRHGTDMVSRLQLLISCIESATHDDISLSVRLIASVAQRAWFTAPQVIIPMFKSLEWGTLPPSAADGFHWGQAHKYAAIVTVDDVDRRTELLQRSLQGYAQCTAWNEFKRTHYAEALILASQYEQAMQQLDEIDEAKRGAFWLQRRAQALAGMHSLDAALRDVTLAIDSLADNSLRPAFHLDRFRIRQALGDPNATEDLDTAMSELPTNHSFRSQLAHERSKAMTGAPR